MQLKLNANLVKRLKDYQKNTSFKELDELVAYIIESYLTEKTVTRKNDHHESLDEVNQRLKDLGYL